MKVCWIEFRTNDKEVLISNTAHKRFVILYEISFFMNVISDKGLKYMSEMSKYNE